jgi:hypothetical protein
MTFLPHAKAPELVIWSSREDRSRNEIIVLADRKSAETAACGDQNARLQHSGLSLVT